MTTLLLVNPAAGHGRARRLAPETRHAAEAAWGPVERLDTPAAGAAVGLVQAAVERGTSRVLVLGGDGTVHEAANGLLRAQVTNRPPLAVVAAGTGNDFAKLCGTERLRPREAVDRLARGQVRSLDVGEGWGEYFLNSIGIGFDAEVAYRLTRLRHGRGILVYLFTVLRTLAGREPFEVEVAAGRHSFRDRLLLLEIGNGPVVGGGFRLTPHARPDDGQFDVCAIQDMPTPLILARLPLAMLGKHLGLKVVRYFRCDRLVVRSPAGALLAQFDGEVRNRSEPLDIRIRPAALPVLFAS
ncbi:MAG TPA: diacylglycerol kinase family protein [Gemmatimonadales bacterium]